MATELIGAGIGVVGAILGAGVGAFLTYRLANRGVSDREQLLKWQVAFNRSAFRGPYQMHSAPQPFLDAIDDTLQALRTGMLVTRSNIDIVSQRGKGMTDLRDRPLRSQIESVATLLEKIRQRVRDQIENQPPGDNFVSEIDGYRDDVIRLMNQAWQRFGIDALPLPTSIATYDRVFSE